MDMEKLFNDLESNNSQEYEEAKKNLAECFSLTKDQWVVQGMLDYYLKTSSSRIIDVLVKVQPPHDKYVFDRLTEWIRGQNKLPALVVFGYIIRKHPTWLFNVAKHALIREILKLLQTEKDIIPLMSALLCIITLLPIIPSLVPNFISELFDAFGHLASWNNVQNSNSKLTMKTENQLIHLQIGLYMLFQRLYGMFPCNFIYYLRQEFIVKEKNAIFQHTIKPLLETVRIHPMLVIASKETEYNNCRWKEMEPHDVVFECVKLSIDYYQDNSECFANVPALRMQDSIPADVSVSKQIQCSIRNSSFQSKFNIASPFYSLTTRENLGDISKHDWSPSIDILATPPPSGTVPHTPTPSAVYGVPTVTNNSVLGATGASPPEAAVEATPESTPMKDSNAKRIVAVNSPAVRAIFASSQPSSPLRKEQTPFHFPDTLNLTTKLDQMSSTTSSQRLLQVVNDRTQSQLHLLNRPTGIESDYNSGGSINLLNSSSFPLTLNDLQSINNTNCIKSVAHLSSIDSPMNSTESTQEDLEVTEFTSQQFGRYHSDTLQDISPEYDDCDDNERSPCSAGGLHIPTSKSMKMWVRRIKHNRIASFCLNDVSSYMSDGTSPAEGTSFTKVRLTKSWPTIDKYQLLEESSTEIGGPVSSKVASIQQNGDSSSPSGDNAISAATHFMKLQQKKNRKLIQHPSPTVDVRNRVHTKSVGIQTLQQWPHIYEYNLLELLFEENKRKNVPDNKRPYDKLDEYIDRTIKMRESAEIKNREELLQDQVQLLQLQLQYERYRREIHAERNRRLLGKSRTNRSLEMDNVRLKDEVAKLFDQVRLLNDKLNKSCISFNVKEQELVKSSNTLKSMYNTKLEDNKQLRSTIEDLQRRLKEETKNRKETNSEIDVMQGELFDMRNDMQHAQFQAELGNHYKQELTKLQSEILILGEMQIKCRDKLAELDNMRARDDEIAQLQEAYNEKIKELSDALETKISQWETAKSRSSELLSQLINRDAMFTDQKRLLESAKEEYEEKFNALEKKYEAQKAIILQMEEHILELSKNQTAVNLATFSPDSDKNDVASSVDHNSPLSNSLASSEGLSASLRSVTEICNLQALVAQPSTSTGHTITAVPLVTTASSTWQQASLTSSDASITSKSGLSNLSHYNSAYQESNMPSVDQSRRLSQQGTLGKSPSAKRTKSTPINSTNGSGRIAATSLDIPVPSTSQHIHFHHNSSQNQ